MLKLRTLILLGVIAVLVPACGGGGGGSDAPPAVDPDGTSGSAVALSGGVGFGDLNAAGDVDFWSFAATAGQVLSIALHGNRLDQSVWDAAANDARMELMDTDGATVLRTVNTSLNPADAELDCLRISTTGTYFIRVFQGTPANAGGQYAVAVTVLSLGALQLEAEIGAAGTNDTAASAEPITANTIFGTQQGNESDFYSITTTGYTIVNVDCKVRRSGGTKDVAVQIIGTDGFTLLKSLDNGFDLDPVGTYLLTVSGTYYIQVTEVGPGSATVEPYCLQLSFTPISPVGETEANDTAGTADGPDGGIFSGNITSSDLDVFMFAGTAGQMIRVLRFDGDNEQGATADMTVEIISTDGTTVLPQVSNDSSGAVLESARTILQTTGNFFVRVSSATVGAYTIVIEKLKTPTYETLPNDTPGTAQILGGPVAGVINPAGDVDVYSFTAVANELVTLAVYAGSTAVFNEPGNLKGFGSTLIPRVTIQGTLGPVITSAANVILPPIGTLNGLATLEVSFVAPAAGTYYATVADNATTGSTTHFYICERR